MGISKEDILQKISSYDILNHYLQPFHKEGARLLHGKNISNPFLPNKQNTPSFNIYCDFKNGHQWKYNDFATDEHGDCFQLVMKLFKLSFPESLKKINQDFSLGLESGPSAKQGSPPQPVIPLEEVTKNDYGYRTRSFLQQELAYWLQYGITIDQLKLFNVKPIDSFTATSREGKQYSQKSIPGNPLFGYIHQDWIKIYRPSEKKYRFQCLGNKPVNFVFGMEQLPEKGEIVFITGGEKDVITLHVHGFNAVSLNSETARIPNELVTELKSRFTDVLLLYDNDETGSKQAEKLSAEHRLTRIKLPPMEHGKDISDYFKLDLPLDDFKNLIQDTLHPQLKNFMQSFRDMARQGMNLKDLKRIFGNFILEHSTVLFPSERGSGKTYLMLQLSIAIATGQKSFCGEPLELHGNVIYINFELGESLMMRRLTRLYRHVPANDSPYEAYCLTFRGNIQDHFNQISEAIRAKKPVLVVIDNLRAAFSDKDNEKNKEMTKAIMNLNKMKDEFGFSFVIVHHTKKGTRDKLTDSDLQSGAGAITDLVDADFFLRRSKVDKNFRLLKRVKSRECEEQDGAKLINMNPDTLWFEVVEENVNESDHIFMDRPVDEKQEKKNAAFEMKGLGKTQQEIADELGVNKSTVSRWFKSKED